MPLEGKRIEPQVLFFSCLPGFLIVLKRSAEKKPKGGRPNIWGVAINCPFWHKLQQASGPSFLKLSSPWQQTWAAEEVEYICVCLEEPQILENID